MPGDRNANHGVSQPTLGWFLLASRWQPTGERGPITKLSKWVTCMIMGHMHDNRLTSGWRNGCSSHRTMPILSHIHVHEKIHSYTDTHRWVEEWMGCSSHMPMLILSPTPASIGRWLGMIKEYTVFWSVWIAYITWMLTLHESTSQEAASLLWTASGALTGSPAGLPTL